MKRTRLEPYREIWHTFADVVKTRRPFRSRRLEHGHVLCHDGTPQSRPVGPKWRLAAVADEQRIRRRDMQGFCTNVGTGQLRNLCGARTSRSPNNVVRPSSTWMFSMNSNAPRTSHCQRDSWRIESESGQKAGDVLQASRRRRRRSSCKERGW